MPADPAIPVGQVPVAAADDPHLPARPQPAPARAEEGRAGVPDAGRLPRRRRDLLRADLRGRLGPRAARAPRRRAAAALSRAGRRRASRGARPAPDRPRPDGTPRSDEGSGHRPDPDRRPRRPRPGLHPRAAPRAVGARLVLFPRRRARPGADPGRGAGAAGRQPLRRQRHPGHDGLHARLLRATSASSAASTRWSTTWCWRCRCPSTSPSSAASRPRRRTPGWRSSATRVGARLSRRRLGGAPPLLAGGQGRLRRAQGLGEARDRDGRADRAAGRGRRPGDGDLPLPRRAARQGAPARQALPAQGAADLALDPLGAQRRRHARPLAAAGEAHGRGDGADRPAGAVRPQPGRRRGLRRTSPR